MLSSISSLLIFTKSMWITFFSTRLTKDSLFDSHLQLWDSPININKNEAVAETRAVSVIYGDPEKATPATSTHALGFSYKLFSTTHATVSGQISIFTCSVSFSGQSKLLQPLEPSPSFTKHAPATSKLSISDFIRGLSYGYTASRKSKHF